MSKSKKKIPALATIGVAVYGMQAYSGYKGTAGGGPGVMGLKWNTLGVDNTGKFVWSKFLQNSLPLIVGVGGSMAASKLDMNRYISAIPWVKF